jgi:small-conductance mechanosensitive channel
MDTINERLAALLGIEPLILLTLLSFGVYMIYKFALNKVSEARHKNLKKLFRELSITYVIYVVVWALQFLILHQWSMLQPVYHYFGIAALILGSILFVRAIKILVFEYLFLNSMTVGVPVLLVNLVTLILSIFIAAWLSTSVFGVRWAPLLATSAIISVVLGLALQDTLGNLFAGVALQFDKPYEIGDWIEVHSASGEKFTGEVFEITWRATVLYGFFDEVLVLPNRIVAQSEVANYSARRKPIYRGLTIFLDASANDDQVKAMLQKVLKETQGVLQHLEHFVMLRDLNEKGAHWRLSYPIVHYNKQYVIVDNILMRTQAELKKAGIQISRLRVDADTRELNPRQPG